MTDTPRPGDALDEATDVFLAHRELLFSLVYNMLGSVADTEDVLQDAWLAWSARRGAFTQEDGEAGERREPRAAGDPRAPGARIANPRAYLVRIAVNLALSRQSSAARRRERYVGPWLPEPLVSAAPGALEPAPVTGPAAGDGAEAVERAEAVSMALLVVLETLTPLQRAVFVLHDVFGYRHTEIADYLDRTPAAVRQLARRAREQVRERRPAHRRTPPRVRREVTERFLAAALGGDLGALMDLLAPDVTMWTDGGGRVRQTVMRPLNGREKVARFIAGVTERAPRGVELRYPVVNGDPAAMLVADGAPFAVMVLELTSDEQQVSEIYTVTNPDKLHPPGKKDTAPGRSTP
ncbi:sigma factor-like helix-turn-helix DNA-binding protein [Phaeacidiphilus oryzae]|uniref:sigma factor-like helix-turn-helix DNA-binding protein n=1 Tax=Phaeacidiphilus oryzae TaxID=348818 RepID=UPI0005635CE6|nr:sigma factor-like helix-turn-helix DNA-binding protein [Phaeacidiphilus oryzae]